MASTPDDPDTRRASERGQAAGGESALALTVRDGAYSGADEARAALDAFVKLAGLQNPTVIRLVGKSGLYIFWTLDRAMSRYERRWMTKALQRACLELGFRADKKPASLPAGTTIHVCFEPAPPTADDLIHPSSRRSA